MSMCMGIGMGMALGNQGASGGEPPSDNTDLSVWTIDGEPAEDGGGRDLVYGTTSVTVVATPADPGASAVVSGDTGLHTGDQVVTVTVTAEDGVTQRVYEYHLHVLTQALPEITQINGFRTGGEYGQGFSNPGLFCVLSGTTIPFGTITRICFYAIRDGESQPDASGAGAAMYLAVTIAEDSTQGDNTEAFRSVINAAFGPSAAERSGFSLIVTDSATGPRDDPYDGGAGSGGITVLQQGVDAV